MVKTAKLPKEKSVGQLVLDNYLFKGLDEAELGSYLDEASLLPEKLFSNRPLYTAFLPDRFLDALYLIVGEGLVITRSTPLDRIIGIYYPGSCFGMDSLPFSYGLASRAFPCLVEAYKTTTVIKLPLKTVQSIYEANSQFRDRYRLLFELNNKFKYHLLNGSTYPPQAVAALLRALIYQERELGNQPLAPKEYVFDLPVDVIARACQLNQRTVEQVLKGMQQVGLIEAAKSNDSGDIVRVVSPEGLKEVYGATRDKVAWWPLK